MSTKVWLLHAEGVPAKWPSVASNIKTVIITLFSPVCVCVGGGGGEGG